MGSVAGAALGAGEARVLPVGADSGVDPSADSDGGVSEVSARHLSLIARWNPQGAALLRALDIAGVADSPGAGAQIVCYAPDDANTTALRAELARFVPQLDLAKPGGRASADSAASITALIIFDAGSIIGAQVLTLIGELRAAGHPVVVAMNGFHAHPDWRAIRDRNLGILAERGFADLDIIAVSARLAQASRAGARPVDPSTSAQLTPTTQRISDVVDSSLLDRSGVAALHARLAASTARSPDEVSARRKAVLTQVLADTRARVTEQVAALRSGDALAQLRAERVELVAERDGGRQTNLAALRSQVHLARVELSTQVGELVRALNARSRAELDRSSRAALRDYPKRFAESVAELTGRVDAAVDSRVAQTADRVASPTPDPLRRTATPSIGDGPDRRHRGVEDHLMIALGASAGLGLGRLVVSPLALVPTLDFASVPVTLLLGGASAGWVVRARGQLADRNHLAQWTSDALMSVKAQLDQHVASAMLDLETVLADFVVRNANARAVVIDRQITELDLRARRLGADAPAQLAACMSDIAELDQLDILIDALTHG
ncbi:hypothetical protein [Nocardia camponoti]|uniref:Uncharacterized protein n=1 Tax=Nocardia camponoti TaxID=1616106 RepID=A0A917QJ63_9NOCA|nr:hypothetical protein [Nocardia camponoti]GGK52997.1 hypothetical protein GCM10011591_25930 [Nocardia camponoti]